VRLRNDTMQVSFPSAPRSQLDAAPLLAGISHPESGMPVNQLATYSSHHPSHEAPVGGLVLHQVLCESLLYSGFPGSVLRLYPWQMLG
jgi:hypothetical protein